MQEQENIKEPIKEAEKKPSKSKTDKKVLELKAKIEELEASLNNEKDNYLRLCAEYDNFRKRTAKEKTDIYANATSMAVEDMLPVIDNFERAVASGGESIDEGLRLIYSQFCEYLEKLGVKAMDDIKFDPTRHIAVMHIEDENYEDSQIVEVFQKGYTLGDKVIRPACVKVAN